MNSKLIALLAAASLSTAALAQSTNPNQTTSKNPPQEQPRGSLNNPNNLSNTDDINNPVKKRTDIDRNTKDRSKDRIDTKRNNSVNCVNGVPVNRPGSAAQTSPADPTRIPPPPIACDNNGMPDQVRP